MTIKRDTMNNRLRPRKRRRNGYLYIAVMFTSLIVAGAIATAFSIHTSRLRTASGEGDRRAALRLGESSLAVVSEILSQTPQWRDEFDAGEVNGWVDAESLSGRPNSFAAMVLNDADGDLDDDSFDEVDVVAFVTLGHARAAVGAKLIPAGEPLSWLRYGITVMDDLRLEHATLMSEREVQVGDNCWTSTNGMIVSPRLHCDGYIGVSTVGGSTADDIAVVDHDIVQRCEDLGTEIPMSSLPIHNSDRAIYGAVISASENSFGEVNPQGIYWIDANGSDLTITQSRIEGTLVVRDADQILVTGGICWESPGALLVTDSPVRFYDVNPILDESVVGANFNPPSTPYRGFDQNTVVGDQFPTSLRGIVYSSDDIDCFPRTDGSPLAITGAVICDRLSLWGDLSIQSYDEVIENVPPGFVDPTRLMIQPGSFYRTEFSIDPPN
ncbi:hypothetical protein LOC67_26730 [Stieleria sp. JC731]|uniref:hypothetical protein n=1 Tax=Pirellulaceae TaxID=2691357 RepID=UPI001E3ED4C5|nr:hypothetical protein [Stieleria sp. JC731]MCC9604165.1 hypothetical protein [Stieleria sp. JC731]